tara:strand:+ start:2211 stop:2594 length:384 start_codon:yes stop_codon:yes gene_type:complete
MKYLLLDTLSGAYVKSSSAQRIELTPDIHQAALFTSEANVTKAFKKLIDKKGDFKIPIWRMVWMNKPEAPVTDYYVSQQAKDVCIAEVSKLGGLNEQERDFWANQQIAPYKLEAHSVEFTLGDTINS